MMAKNISSQEKIIEQKKNELILEKEKLAALMQKKVTINLGDLIKELQALFNANGTIKIEYKIAETSGMSTKNIKSVEEFINSIAYDGYFLKSKISIYYNMPENSAYNNYIYLKTIEQPNLKAVQNDGKTLAEHCSLCSYIQNFTFSEEKELIVDKDIESVNISIPYADLVNKTGDSQSGSKLFKAAIFNILSYKKAHELT